MDAVFLAGLQLSFFAHLGKETSGIDERNCSPTGAFMTFDKIDIKTNDPLPLFIKQVRVSYQYKRFAAVKQECSINICQKLFYISLFQLLVSSYDI